MRINIIAAESFFNHGIGYKNNLLFHIADDLARFKKFTRGNSVIMGRKTYESLPNGALPDRRNIVITRNSEYEAENCKVVNSLEDALDVAELISDLYPETFIIGGASIYEQAIPLLKPGDKIYLTKVIYEGKADAFFPKLNMKDFDVYELDWRKDEKTGLTYRYVEYTKLSSETDSTKDKKRKKIYVSCPMTGCEHLIAERIDQAKSYIKNNLPDFKIVMQDDINEIIETGISMTGADYNQVLGKDIADVLDCDAIVMCVSWENSKGCQLEHSAAKIFNKTIIYL